MTADPAGAGPAMRTLLISTYELGRQPFGLASPAAWLQDAGITVSCRDLSRESLTEADVAALADGPALVAFHLPMHTATRLAAPVIRRLRRSAPAARLCAYGLYAPLNETWLRDLGVTDVLGGEFEAALLDLAQHGGPSRRPATGAPPRLSFRVPARAELPPLARYATLQHAGTRRSVGYTEASRGCRYHCRHCPVVPVYDGHFRVVPRDVVLADIAQQVADGARHITFGDPDFFNGVGHALRIVETMAERWPDVTYDATIKVEHLVRHRDRLSQLVGTGCAFVTTAVESFDDAVLDQLQKGHTVDDVRLVARIAHDAGLTLAPTFVAFTPWTTLETYADMLVGIAELGWVDHVAPIQLALRLLIPEGSTLLSRPEVRRTTMGFDDERLSYRWRHPDARVDELAADVGALVGRRLRAARRVVFRDVWSRVEPILGTTRRLPPLPARTDVPYLNEPWYC